MAPDDLLGRRISDPAALRALAHPARYAILDRLQTEGTATATECAQVTGLSPSACSYHLRLLARHGFVEEDREAAADRDGRERVWRRAITSWQSDPDPEADPAEVQAIDSTMARVMLASSDEKVLAFVDQSATEPVWRDAALLSNSTIAATAGELTAISAAIMTVLAPYVLSERALAEAPAGAREVHVAVRTAPRSS